MSYRIASFNVCNLNFGSAGINRVENIANIINKNNLDIVVMQEVLGEGRILTGGNQKHDGSRYYGEKSLLNRLYKTNRDWRICWRNPEIRAKDYPYVIGDKRGEGYAFLWDAKKFELTKDKNNDFQWPQIYRNYKADKMLVRQPCYGKFKIKGYPIEIRLITTHIAFGKPKINNPDFDYDGGAITFRNKEFKTLAGKIYPSIAAEHKQAPHSYTIILGDYNLNLSNSKVSGGYLEKTKNSVENSSYSECIAVFDSKGNMLENAENVIHSNTIYTNQHELTTIKKDGTGLANNYDHFSYSENEKKIIKDFGVLIRDLNTESDYQDYLKKVSDHLPIFLEIDFK